MAYILKDKDGNILSFGESSFIPNLSTGQTMEYSDISFYEYARRLVLSHAGQTGLTVKAYQSGPDVQVDVSTSLPVETIDLDINGVKETVIIEGGKGKLLLSTAQPGLFVVTPADRKQYCTAGNGTLVVEVAPNA